MSDLRGKAQKVLDGLTAAGLLGAGLVSRDGLPVLLRFGSPVQEETFSAMSAALFGAAEAALQELGEQRAAWAHIETSDVRLVVTGLDESHLLVGVAAAKSDAGKVRAQLEDARKSLRAVLGG